MNEQEMVAWLEKLRDLPKHPVLKEIVGVYCDHLLAQGTLPEALQKKLAALEALLLVLAWADEKTVSFWLRIARQHNSHLPVPGATLKPRKWQIEREEVDAN